MSLGPSRGQHLLSPALWTRSGGKYAVIHVCKKIKITNHCPAAAGGKQTTISRDIKVVPLLS
jgi:hypothetical protein